MPDTSPKNTAAQQRGKGMQSTRQPEKAGAEHIETVRQTPVPSRRLKQIFMVICGVFFLLLYAVLSVYNSAFSCFKAYIVLPLALVVICALYFLYRLLCRSTDFLERNLRALLFVLLGAAACISLGVGIFARFTPAYDLGAIYYGGYELAQTGSLGSYTEYFAMFSNNLGGLGIFTALAYICSFRHKRYVHSGPASGHILHRVFRGGHVFCRAALVRHGTRIYDAYRLFAAALLPHFRRGLLYRCALHALCCGRTFNVS